MKNNSAKRLEILLWLTLRQQRKNRASEIETEAFEASENKSAELPPLFALLTKAEIDKLNDLLANYGEKSPVEKENWEKEIKSFIGTDRRFFDEYLHWSHIEESLKSETPSVKKIIYDGLSEDYKVHLKNRLGIDEELLEANDKPLKKEKRLVFQAVQEAFGKQFVFLGDLPKPTAFDKLNGAQTVRLIRLAGIREVAFACASIEAVETLAAFLKRFPAEAARAIATQLNSLPKTSGERLAFAESLVRQAFELEPQPTAMLDLLGIWLIGIRLCESSEKRIAYAQQKLPKEFAPELTEIIDKQCRKTNAGMQKTISAQIEQLAETILKTSKTENKSLK